MHHQGVCCCADQKIALLGAMQSLFEGSMYTFVFLWTPALSPHGEHLPHGMIFACFMVSASAHAQSNASPTPDLLKGRQSQRQGSIRMHVASRHSAA